MQPIICRTITITVTETWTITWQDDQEMVWQDASEPGQPLTPTLDYDSDGSILGLAAIDLIAEDEYDLATPLAPGQANPDAG